VGFAGSAFTGGSAYYYKRANENMMAQFESERRMATIVDKSSPGVTYTPEDIMEIVHREKEPILNNEATVHMVENKIIYLVKFCSF